MILAGVVGYALFALRRRGLSVRSITTLVFAALFTAVVSLALVLVLGRYVYFDSPAFFFLTPVTVVALFVGSERAVRFALSVAARASQRTDAGPSDDSATSVGRALAQSR